MGTNMLANESGRGSDNYDTLIDSTMGSSLQDLVEALANAGADFVGTVKNGLLDSEKAYRKAYVDNLKNQRAEEKKYKEKAAAQYIKFEQTLYKGYTQKQRQEKLKELEEEFKKRDELEKALEEKKRKRAEQSAGARQFNPLDWSTYGKLKESGANAGQVITALSDKLLSGLSSFAKQLSGTITTIGSYQSNWDTRLYGSSFGYSGLIGSSQKLGSATTLFKQSELNNNINKAVELGIAYNIEQRAFLETISDKIATTFDAFDSNLLQIIRVQQADTTAARLGMEANLTTYLNSMFSDSSYLNSTRGSVTSALYNALSLMNNGNMGIDVEYQAQKWLGSLYSVGMSNQSISSIAGALGQLLSGDVSGLTSGSGMLLNMAASKSGLSISDMLVNGLDSSEMNKLLTAMVEYLETIANDNHVVQTQYAKIFGLATSDIQAARNLSGSLGEISKYGTGYGYSSAIGNLLNMAGSMGSRVSVGEQMTNALDNLKYTLAAGIANNPVLYGIYEVASMLDNVAGGIKIPDFSVMGTGVSLNTSVADLMRVATLGGSLLTSMGNIVSSVSNGNNAQTMLNSLGITGTATAMVRGSGLSLGSVTGQEQQSQKNYVGNNDGDNVQSTYESEGDNQRQEVLNENTSDAEKTMTDLYDKSDAIYELLLTVISPLGYVVTQERSMDPTTPPTPPGVGA